MNKLKGLLLTISSVLFTFVLTTQQADVKLNALARDLKTIEKIEASYRSDKTKESGFIEDFIVRKRVINSNLHYENDYIDSKEMYYNDLDLSEYQNKWNPHIIFDDVFYEKYRSENNYSIFSVGNFYSNHDGYGYPDYILNDNYPGGDVSEIDHLGFVYDSGLQKEVKRGFSDINGVSLVANDIYINTKFDKDLSNSNNIDLALCNSSNYNIDWITLLDRVCYNLEDWYKEYLTNSDIYTTAWTFQYPLIKVDGDEFVNVVFTPFGAYIVTHNCCFSISENGKEIYLSLPYMNYIEKITISVPFFTGGFNPYLTTQSPDGVYAYAYMKGTEIISEIQEVMTSFEPKLWNNDTRAFIPNGKFLGIQFYKKLYNWCPLQVEDFDKQNGYVTFTSNINLDYSVSSLTIKRDDKILGSKKTFTIDKLIDTNNSHTLIDENTGLAYGLKNDNEFIYQISISDLNYSNSFGFSIDSISYTIDYGNFSIMPNSTGNKVANSIKNKRNINYSNSEEPSVQNQFNTEFMYVDDRTARIIHGKYRYHEWVNPNWWGKNFRNEPFWIVNGVMDETKSTRDLVYIDFYWDSSLTNKIDNIDSLRVVLPKKDGSVILEKDNILDHMKNPENEEWYFANYYESDTKGHYNLFFMPTPTSSFYDDNTLNGELTYFDDEKCRFLYLHYNGKKATNRIDSSKIYNDSSSCFAQLKVFIEADQIVKCTTAENGYHIEYDDDGDVLGIFDQFGNLQEDYEVDDDGYIVNTETGEKVDNYYDYKNIQEYHDEKLNQYLDENSLLYKIKSFFANIGEKFKDGFKGVLTTLLTIGGVVVLVIFVPKISNYLTLKKIKNSVKKPRRKKIKRKK